MATLTRQRNLWRRNVCVGVVLLTICAGKGLADEQAGESQRINFPVPALDWPQTDNRSAWLESEAVKQYKAGNYQRALDLFRAETLTKPNPTDGLFYWLYGNVCARLTNWDEAVLQYDRWITLEPTNGIAYSCRARVFMEQGNFNRALDDVSTAIRLGPQSVWIYQLLASIHFKKGDVDEGIAELNAQIAKRGDDSNLYKSRGALYFEKEELAKADADFDAAMRLDPKDASACALSGELNNRKHDWTKAIQSFSRAIGLNSHELAANYAGRAFAKMKSGQPDAAIEDYTRAIKSDPGKYLCFSARGYLYLKKKNFEKAESDFLAALKLNPKEAPIMANLSACYDHEHREQEAATMASNALALQPTSTYARIRHALACEHLGEYSLARDDYEKVLELAPKDSLAANSLAWLLATCPDSSVRNGERAVELAHGACADSHWEKWNFVGTLAASYAETGRFDLARKYNEEAVKLAGEDKTAVAELATARKAYEANKPFRNEK